MTYKEQYQEWLSNPYFDENTKAELKNIADDENEIKERFYKELEFGTAGLRGIIGAGTNRMNIYTVRKATQGLANYIISQGFEAKGVAIAYDSRRMSPEFANETALCLAANGVKAYVFESLRPTPELSFAVRKLGCIAGVNITAPITARNMPAPVKSYLQDASSLEEKKVQKVNNPKKSKLQVFSGMKKFAQNHKTGIKRGLALAGAGVVTVTAIKTNGFGLFNGENKNTGTQAPTPTPGIHGTILTGIYSNEFNNAVSTNMTKYAPYRNILESTYGCSFEDIVRGYTFIENCGTMDTSNIGRNEMIKLITDGDKMIQLLVVNGQYGNISPEARNAIYGGFGTSVAYIQNNNAINGGSLLDYMTVGGAARTTLEAAVSNNQATTEDLLNLNSTIINPGLEVYLFKLENGLGASSLNNQKTFGTHPAMSRA